MLRLQCLFFLLVSISSFSREAEFSWQASPDAIEYELQVSTTRNFENLSFTTKTPEPIVKAELSFGNYFYRIRAIDSKKRPGLWSKPEALSIAPYAPETIMPDKDARYNYYEKKALIPFSWKKMEGEAIYEILITDNTGKKVLEKKSKSEELIIDQLTEGNYFWQLRAIFQGKLYSQYSGKIPFQVTKTELKAPSLIHPKDQSDLASFREDRFQWTKDPVAKYTSIQLERLDKSEDLEEIGDIEEIESIDMPSLMPGKYRWRVITKEEKETVGAASSWANFKTSTAVVSNKDHLFRYSTSMSKHSYSYQSDRFGSVNESGVETSNYLEIYNRFQLTKGFGIGLEMQQSFQKLYLEKQEISSKNSIYAEFRFGENDFIQNNFIGYRMKDVYDRNASGSGERISISGLVLGFTMEGYLGFQQKLRLSAIYFKPNKSLQTGVEIKSDFYEAKLSYAYNILERFWLEYEVGFERSLTEVEYSVGNRKSKLTSENMTPIHLKLSYEY